MRQDGVDLFATADARSLQTPAVLLCAPRGLQNEPNPMQPLELVREWEAQAPESRRGLQVPDVNHYTIAVGRRGAEAVAAEIARSITLPPPERRTSQRLVPTPPRAPRSVRLSAR